MKIKTIASLVCLGLCFLGSKTFSQTQEKETLKKLLKEIRMEESEQTPEQKEAKVQFDEGFSLVGLDDILKIKTWMQTDARIFGDNHPGSTQLITHKVLLLAAPR